MRIKVALHVSFVFCKVGVVVPCLLPFALTHMSARSRPAPAWSSQQAAQVLRPCHLLLFLASAVAGIPQLFSAHSQPAQPPARRRLRCTRANAVCAAELSAPSMRPQSPALRLLFVVCSFLRSFDYGHRYGLLWGGFPHISWVPCFKRYVCPTCTT